MKKTKAFAIALIFALPFLTGLLCNLHTHDGGYCPDASMLPVLVEMA